VAMGGHGHTGHPSRVGEEGPLEGFLWLLSSNTHSQPRRGQNPNLTGPPSVKLGSSKSGNDPNLKARKNLVECLGRFHVY